MAEQPERVLRTDDIAGRIVHEYDGIEEADNQLPLWWLTLFFAAIVFGVAYWFAFHEYGLGQLPGQAYAVAKAEKQARAERQARALAAQAGGVGLEALGSDLSLVSAGEATFKVSCSPCHGMSAEGNIGPNLTDNAWIHGGAAEDMQQVINEGVAAKGMPAWGTTLGPVAVQQLVAYLVSIRDQNVPGKPPQGEPYVPDGASQ